MATLRTLHQIMNERRQVVLSDGRVGKVVRVDTLFPDNFTTVTIWTPSHPPQVAKVALSDIIDDPARESA